MLALFKLELSLPVMSLYSQFSVLFDV
uniref:Uncharacterized protein n=1 Tax=Rhizophora mucronata TaxID=61149 RepID=A0A2P2NEG4_RHIMU